MSTFVSVGNARQPFRRLLDTVTELAPRLPQPVIVQHGHTPFTCSNCQCTAFMGMEEFSGHIRNAELLILHAGAGSVIHALEAGKRPIVMPRRASEGEHVNDHQVEFARALAVTKRVIVADGPQALERAIAESMSGAGTDIASPPPELLIIKLVRQTLQEYEQNYGR